jgi:hypothetical protein
MTLRGMTVEIVGTRVVGVVVGCMGVPCTPSPSRQNWK